MLEIDPSGLLESLASDKAISIYKQTGMCRLWASKVLDLAKKMKLNDSGILIEAREVEIEPGLNHTFIRININNVSYIWDGVGTFIYEPYLGKEDEAPEYLKNSKSDMLNSLR